MKVRCCILLTAAGPSPLLPVGSTEEPYATGPVIVRVWAVFLVSIMNYWIYSLFLFQMSATVRMSPPRYLSADVF